MTRRRTASRTTATAVIVLTTLIALGLLLNATTAGTADNPDACPDGATSAYITNTIVTTDATGDKITRHRPHHTCVTEDN